MDLGRTLDLLKDALNEVPFLQKLRYDNAMWDLWCYKAIDTVKAGFGQDSDEYKRFVQSVESKKRVGTPFELQEWYARKVNKGAAALLSIIQKYDILGEEAIHSETGKISRTPPTPRVQTPRRKINQLKQFLRELEEFRRLQISAGDSRQDPELEKLRTKLVRKSAQIKRGICPHGGRLIFTQFNQDFDAFDTAFTKPIYPWGIPTQWHAAVNLLVQKTNETIGKLGTLSTSEVLREAVYPSDTPYSAYRDIRDIIVLATKKLMLVDPYVDGSIVTLLENVRPGVEIQVLTRSMQGDFELAGRKFKEERQRAGHGTLEVRKDKGTFHDRFILADYNFFHVGASIKDAGTKLSAINEIKDRRNKSTLMKTISKAWDAAEKVL